jgi:hypothetical protein
VVFSIYFLSHRLDLDGVLPLTNYVDAKVTFPPPTNVKELQGFFGILNFCRRFLPSLANILRPLSDVLHGDNKVADPIIWLIHFLVLPSASVLMPLQYM